MKRLVKSLAVLTVMSLMVTSFSYLAYAQDSDVTTTDTSVEGALIISKHPTSVGYNTLTSTADTQIAVPTNWDEIQITGGDRTVEVTSTLANAFGFLLTVDFSDMTNSSNSALTPIDSLSHSISTADVAGTLSVGTFDSIIAPASDLQTIPYGGSGIVIIDASFNTDTINGQVSFDQFSAGYPITTYLDVPPAIVSDQYNGVVTFTAL